MRILYDNLIDYSGVTLTESTQASDLPAENVIHPHRAKVWRTGTSGADETLVMDLGSSKAVQAFVVLDHTLTSGDSAIKIQGHSSDSWASPSVNVTLSYNADVIQYYWGASQTYRYWRFIFTKSAAGVTRDVGRIFIGPYYECDSKPSYDSLVITPTDMSDSERAISGATYSDQRDIYHDVTCDFDYVDDTQMDYFKTIANMCGTHTPLFVDIDPTNMAYDWLYYVKMKKLEGRKVRIYKDSSPLWSVRMQFTEEL